MIAARPSARTVLVAAIGVLVAIALVGAVLRAGGAAAGAQSGTVPMPAPAARTYAGLGTWVDMYSWSETFTKGRPKFGLGDIDDLAARGVQTLYLQGASQTGDGGVLEPDRLRALIGRAHRRGLGVVVWYLPSLTDVGADYSRLVALGRLPADGVGVDIESRDNPDLADRNAKLVALSRLVRRRLGRVPLAAIVLPPTLLEVVNPGFWPAFPWRAIAPYYDAWLPMAYWTLRLPASGLQDGYRYTLDSIVRLRADLGLTAAAVDPIGGLAGQLGVGDLARFAAAVRQGDCAGASVYDWRETAAAAWPDLLVLRS